VGGLPLITADPDKVRNAGRLILPGVGAFGDAMENLRQRGLDAAIRQAVKARIPLLGVCLGLQLLFSRSEEFGNHEGLDLIPGSVLRFDQPGLRVPHIGWNQIEGAGQLFLFRTLPVRRARPARRRAALDKLRAPLLFDRPPRQGLGRPVPP
jgi:imidazole glycerol phosphate synthase glutamine amidotransferase subunit